MYNSSCALMYTYIEEYVPYSQKIKCIFILGSFPGYSHILSQLWKKIGRRPGTIATSWTGNGGFSWYIMWQRLLPMQYAVIEG